MAFFLWTVAHGQILNIDNLMLRGRSFANRCCMCHCDGESVDHVLVHCPVTYLMDFYASGLWYSLGYARICGRIVILLASMAFILQIFGI